MSRTLGLLTTAAILLAQPCAGSAQTLADYTIDHARSDLYVVTHTAGLLSFLGHEHAVIPSAWTGTLCLSEPLTNAARGTIGMEVRSLIIDTDSARILAGLSGVTSPSDRDTLQVKMLDAAHLDALLYPEIRLDVDSVAIAGPAAITGHARMTLHGVTRAETVSLTITRHAESLELTGVLRIRQRDYGIEPESRAGVVKVSNDVDLHVRLWATKTALPCTEPTGQ
jgi:polyisoprenoid-binding protein YceI